MNVNVKIFFRFNYDNNIKILILWIFLIFYVIMGKKIIKCMLL